MLHNLDELESNVV